MTTFETNVIESMTVEEADSSSFEKLVRPFAMTYFRQFTYTDLRKLKPKDADDDFPAGDSQKCASATASTEDNPLSAVQEHCIIYCLGKIPEKKRGSIEDFDTIVEDFSPIIQTAFDEVYQKADEKSKRDAAAKKVKRTQEAQEKAVPDIANGGVSKKAKKPTIELTPEQAAAKEAAAKERETDKAGKKRQHEADALDIKDSGVSKKPKVERTPKEEEALRKRREKDAERRVAKKAAEALEKELDIVHAKEVAEVEKELAPLQGILNKFMHEVFENLIIKKSGEEDPYDILPFELKNMAYDMKEIAFENLNKQDISRFNKRPLDELLDLLVQDIFETIDMRKQVDTDFMNNNFPISDPWVYKQQVASDTSAGCDVSANPSAHDNNVSDSSCDSDENAHLSDSDKHERVAKKDEGERLSHVGSDSGCESDGDPIVVTPGAGGSYSKDKSPLRTPGTPPTPLGTPVTPGGPYSRCDSNEDEHLSDVGSNSGSDSEDESRQRTPVTPGGPYSRCDSDEDEHLSDVGSDGGSDLEVANQDEDEHLSDVGSDGGSDLEVANQDEDEHLSDVASDGGSDQGDQSRPDSPGY